MYIVVCTDDTRTIFLKQNSNEVSVRSVFLLGILAAEPCKRVISVCVVSKYFNRVFNAIFFVLVVSIIFCPSL